MHQYLDLMRHILNKGVEKSEVHKLFLVDDIRLVHAQQRPREKHEKEKRFVNKYQAALFGKGVFKLLAIDAEDPVR